MTLPYNQYRSFFQLARSIERAHPESAPIGQLGPAAREFVWFRHSPSFAFATSDITSVVTTDRHVLVTTAFIGLTGTTTPLATYYAEDVIRSDDTASAALTAFYDLFHHRILSFVYRCWTKYRPMSQFVAGGQDPFTRRALTLIGVEPDAPAASGALPPFVQLSLAPVLVGRVRSARALEIVLRRVFSSTPMRIECFISRRVELDDPERIKLGSVNTTIGEDFTIGRTVHDRSGRFRVKVGPVDFDTAERFVPGGQDFPKLRGIVEHFTRGVLEAELEIELDESATPRFRLAAAAGARLGVTSRIGTKKQGRSRQRFLLSDDMQDVRPIAVPDV
ncbi:MAG TPA: type VI secretion system baseplate subunit TssG [Polyangiaceae bacterium]|nr:type VI secretion system baseplate subunit TssG [Polyangiaceae bacterium]